MMAFLFLWGKGEDHKKTINVFSIHMKLQIKLPIMAHSVSSEIICCVTTSDPASVIDNHLIDKDVNISR